MSKSKVRDVLTEELFLKEYVENRKTIKEIAKETGFSDGTVEKIFKYFRKKYKTKRNYNLKRILITKEFLIEQNHNLNKPIAQIARETGYAATTLCAKMSEFGIQTKIIYSGPQENFAGVEVGNIKVIGLSNRRTNDGQYLWECECKCFNKTKFRVDSHRIKNNKIISCRYCAYCGEISGRFWQRLIHRAKRDEIELNITKEYIWNLFLEQERICVYTGRILYFTKYHKDYLAGKETASLDRRNSSLGYIKGNVQWIHKDINYMKYIFPEDLFLSTIREIYNYRKLYDE